MTTRRARRAVTAAVGGVTVAALLTAVAPSASAAQFSEKPSGPLLGQPGAASTAGVPVLARLTTVVPDLAARAQGNEGLAVDPVTGAIYSPSLFSGAVTVFDAGGRYLRSIPLTSVGGPVTPLGALFVPGEGLYVCDAEDAFTDPASPNGRLLRVDPASGRVDVVADHLGGAPNAVTRDRAGNLYVGSPFTGVVHRITPAGRVTVWSDDALLGPRPGIAVNGVNGLAFDPSGRYLYATHPTAHQVLRIPVRADGSAGRAQVVADGATIDATQHTTGALVRADGIAVDVRGHLFVAKGDGAGSAIEELAPSGRLLRRYVGAGDDAVFSPTSLAFRRNTLFASSIDFPSDGVPGARAKISALRLAVPGLPV